MMKRLMLLLLFVLPLLAGPRPVVQMSLQGTVSPASSDFLESALEEARTQNAQLLIMELDTPGGLVSAMREMIQAITNSPVPVAVYVSPRGAHAASAGTYLLYAAHIAAMAPGTNLGAATPVSMMPTGGELNATMGSMEKKALSDAMASIKSLAELRERNVTWALAAVKEAESLSAVDAVRFRVADLLAEDADDLLRQIDGMTLQTAAGAVTLQTEGAPRIAVEPDWKTRLLSVITYPNIAYVLLLVGIYGIFFEMMNPGSFFPGVIGVISGLLALYALNVLPFNYAGLALMLVGIAFMVAEVFVAGFGILGIGGVAAFALGSLLLFDAQTLGSGVSIPLVIAFTLVSLGFFVVTLRYLWKSRSQKAHSGAEEMEGAEAEVLELLDGERCRVHVHGETWTARSTEPLRAGQKVRVVALEGLTLLVTPISTKE